MRINKQEREKFWREQLEAGRNRTGSLESFCRERGLSISSYENWRRRLEGKKTAKQIRGDVFLPIEVSSSVNAKSHSNFIDPIWLAEFILRLHRGLDESSE